MEKVCTYQIGRKMFFFFFWLMKDKYEFKDEFFPVFPLLRKENKNTPDKKTNYHPQQKEVPLHF